ncbi:MAG: 50S ribosomal protein L24 [Nitrosomonas sp.]|jgi:large subunit ribosomal protein L24|nr:50S ribosomal protein L24 [Nitrosomonas sp.]
MKKIRKGDKIVVIAGKDKGKKTTVLGFQSEELVLVQDVNKVKKHIKPNPQKNEIGGIKDIYKPIHISNIALYNFDTKKADRVGFKFDEAGNKYRYFKGNGSAVDN